MSESLPNFLIVGAAKAATTSIHDYLKQHPDVFMTELKEPCFFTFYNEPPPTFTTDRKVRFVHDITEYKNLFKESSISHKVKGESSTPYMFFYKKTVENLKKILPNTRDLKILIVLRNPIDRAYSQYMMKVRDVVEDLSFEEAIKQEKNRIKSNAHFDFFYLKRGLYFNQVKHYMDNFENVKVVFYDDFKRDKDSFFSDILEFLALDYMEFQTIKKKNVSGVPRVKFLNDFILSNLKVKRAIFHYLPDSIRHKINKVKKAIFELNIAKPPKMRTKTRENLKEFYKEDVTKLSRLLKKDLSYWFE